MEGASAPEHILHVAQAVPASVQRQLCSLWLLIALFHLPMEPATMNRQLGFIALLSPLSSLPWSPPCHPSHPSEDFIQGREHNKKLNYTLQINQGSIFLKESLLRVPSWFGGVALPAQSIPEHGFSVPGQCNVPFSGTHPTESCQPPPSQAHKGSWSSGSSLGPGAAVPPCSWAAATSHWQCPGRAMGGLCRKQPTPEWHGMAQQISAASPDLEKSSQLPAEQDKPVALPLGSPMPKPSLSTWAWLYCRVGPAAPTDP